MEYNILIKEPAWNYLRNTSIIIILLVVAIFALVFNVYWHKKKRRQLMINEKMQTILLLIVFIIGIVISTSKIYDDILYAYDYKHHKNYIVTEHITKVIREDRDTCIIYTDTNEFIVPSYEYSLKEYGELYSYIDNNFTGNICQIEFFEFSKYVKKIKIIE